ncbi:MAG TPA: aminoglycoside adenylyltransferase domain-containing protein [Acidimicrobiales bacterium]
MDEIVGSVADAYLALADEALPERIEGLYLVGSVALGDFVADQSDIDFVAVTGDPLDELELGELESTHEKLAERFRRPFFSGVYVTWADLKGDPAHIEAVPAHHEGRFSATGGFDANPVQWLTLRQHPVAVRGPAAPEVWHDDAVLRAWVLDNLRSYWATWVARQQKLVGRGTMMLSDWAITWGVLGLPRLHKTLATGQVISKTAAGEYALATFADSWSPIIREALRIRTGGAQAPTYRRRPLARRRDALAFMAHALDDALARFTPSGPDGPAGPAPAGPAAPPASEGGDGQAASSQ